MDLDSVLHTAQRELHAQLTVFESGARATSLGTEVLGKDVNDAYWTKPLSASVSMKPDRSVLWIACI